MAAFWQCNVEFISHTDLAFVSGRILLPSIQPRGRLQTVTLWVGDNGREALPALVDVRCADHRCQRRRHPMPSAFFNNTWFSPNNLFGNSSMLVGPANLYQDGTFSSPTFTADFISLRRQALYWPWLAVRRQRDRHKRRQARAIFQLS